MAFSVVSFVYLSAECPSNKFNGINCRSKLGAKLLDRFFHRLRRSPHQSITYLSPLFPADELQQNSSSADLGNISAQKVLNLSSRMVSSVHSITSSGRGATWCVTSGAGVREHSCVIEGNELRA